MRRRKKLTKKIDYYLAIAKAVASRSSCSRRKFGAIIVKNDSIVATGYNGTIRGALNCGEEIKCLKDLYDEDHFKSYDHCPAVHAEENACLLAGKHLADGGVMYISSIKDIGNEPCFKCRRKIAQVGITDVYYKDKAGLSCHEDVSFYPERDNEWMMELYERVNPNWVKEKIEEGD